MPIRRKRVLLIAMVLGILKRCHAAHFPGRNFCSDLTLQVVLGSIILSEAEGRPATATKISHHIDTPRETVRRAIKELLELGLVETHTGRSYRATDKVLSEQTDALIQLIRETSLAL